MKKIVTINLFGTLYTIDEDACELLKNYLDGMRGYFSSREGGEEIVDDIEHRIAELLTELRSSGIEAVTVEHIEEIIHRIGNPEQMDTGQSAVGSVSDPNGQTEDSPSKKVRRKWYRNLDDKMLGGVMSGLSCFFGGRDPLPWRIGIVLLTVFSSGLFVLGYLVLWAFLPPARTPEEKLCMRGEPVTPKSLNEEIVRGFRNAREAISNPEVNGTVRGCLSTLMSGLAWCMKGVFFLAILMTSAVILALLWGAFWILIALFGWLLKGADGWSVGIFSAVLNDGDLPGVLSYLPMPVFCWETLTLFVVVVALVVITGYAAYRLLASMFGAKSLPVLKRGTIVVLLITWLLCLTAAFTLGFMMQSQIKDALDRQDKEVNTHDGHYILKDGWNLLQNMDLKVVTMQNCLPDMIEYNVGFRKENDHCLKVRNGFSSGATRCCLQRVTNLPRGMYRLEGVACADGRGCYLYVYGENRKDMMMTEVPNNGEQNGDLFSIPDRDARGSLLLKNMGDSLSRVAAHSRFSGWNYVRIDSIRHSGGALCYGITNDKSFTKQPWMGTWFSLADMALIPLDGSH